MAAAPLAVSVLVLPSVVPFDLGVPVQVFGYPRADLGAQRYRMTVCGVRRGAVPTAGGFAVAVEHGLEALAAAHTVVVPGIDDLDAPVPPAVCRALVAAHARGARLVSICTGAFVLAAAGSSTAGARRRTGWTCPPSAPASRAWRATRTCCTWTRARS
jgi:transcriptional regulator GlxA family with amidase domain